MLTYGNRYYFQMDPMYAQIEKKQIEVRNNLKLEQNYLKTS